MSDGASHDGGAKKSVKGEKSKKKIVSSPSPSSDAGSAAGGGKGGESSTDDNDGVDNGVFFPKIKLGDLGTLVKVEVSVLIVLCCCNLIVFVC